MSEDRRQRRRADTVREILDVAVDVMAADGVAALSLSEVARRMGMRAPSLYQYFPSRLAIYDALFERGMQQTVEVMEQHQARLAKEPLQAIAVAQQAVMGWVMANPVLAQLMYWRPVPGFEPSPQAFAPALRQYEILRAALQTAVNAGQLAPGAASDEGVALYTVLMSGVISQQLANQPGEPAGQGRFIQLTPKALDMFVRYYTPKEGESNDRVIRRGRKPAGHRP